MNKIPKKVTYIFLIGLLTFITVFGLMSFNVIKNPFEKKPDDLTLSQSEIRLQKYNNYQLTAKVLPDNMKNQKIVFESNNPEIVSVNEITGYLEAKRNGIATITVYLDDYKNIKSQCLVIVSDNDIRIERIILSTKRIYIQEGNEYQINYKIIPKEAALYEIEYMTSDPRVATVDKRGNIKGVKSGTALVVVSDKVSGVYEEVEVNVYEKSSEGNPTSLTVSPKEMKISVGGSGQIDATVEPEGTNNSITYESIDSSIATVSNIGIVTGIKEGITKILATTINGIEDYITVKVTNDIVKVKGINITNKNINMDVGDSAKINYKINPTNATNQGIRIISDDENIVKVEGTRLLALNSGTANIIIETEDGNFRDKAKVTVNKVKKIILENNITLSKNSTTIVVGGTETIKATVTPSNATYKNVLWKSEDNNIATVSDGLIVGKSVGKTNIIVTTAYKKISKKISVTVLEQEVQGISLNKKTASLTMGDTLTLIKTISPSNATNKNVVWTSSNPNVATVNNGVVTPVSVGTTTITVQTVNNKTAICTVTVKENTVPVTGISLDKQVINTDINDRVILTATVTPSNATNKKITWASSNLNVVKVSDGVVETIGVGTATITAMTINGKVATCEVVVRSDSKIIDVTSITLNEKDININVHDKENLYVTIEPSNATNKNVTWESSNNSVVTVIDGVIEGIEEGIATITVKTSNGKSDTCNVVVTNDET